MTLRCLVLGAIFLTSCGGRVAAGAGSAQDASGDATPDVSAGTPDATAEVELPDTGEAEAGMPDAGEDVEEASPDADCSPHVGGATSCCFGEPCRGVCGPQGCYCDVYIEGGCWEGSVCCTGTGCTAPEACSWGK